MIFGVNWHIFIILGTGNKPNEYLKFFLTFICLNKINACYFRTKNPTSTEFSQSDRNFLSLMLKSNTFQIEEPWKIFQKTFLVLSYSHLFIKNMLKMN